MRTIAMDGTEGLVRGQVGTLTVSNRAVSLSFDVRGTLDVFVNVYTVLVPISSMLRKIFFKNSCYSCITCFSTGILPEISCFFVLLSYKKSTHFILVLRFNTIPVVRYVLTVGVISLDRAGAPA